MKKLLILITIAICAGFASCTDPIDKARDYREQMNEAIEDGDEERYEEINKEAEEWAESLSSNDRRKVLKAMLEDMRDDAEE